MFIGAPVAIEILIALCIAVLTLLLFARLWRLCFSKPRATGFSANAVLVDGSNLMFWGGEPSQRVLCEAIRELEALGHDPYVLFDASVGYKLFGGYRHHQAMAEAVSLPQSRVMVMDKGVPADHVLLQLADEHHLPVVSNDRFRDWARTYSWVGEGDRFLRGRWRDESVTFW